MLKQRTLKSLVRTVGIGVHSGVRVELVLRPAAADTGLVFRRTDLDPPVDVRAAPDAVVDTTMATTLGREGASIATVEHLASALAGLGIDNCYIDVDAGEIPVMDGSAASFVFLIQSAGVVELNAPRRFVRVKKTVRIGDGDKWAQLEPHFGYKLAFSIDFKHPAIDATEQHVEVDFARDRYTTAVARARTFGFANEVEALRAMGLGQGGNLENLIVMDEYRVLNVDGLRSGDEFAKHKLLDAMGDMAMLGHPLLAAYRAHKSGHALNNKLLRALLAHAQAWEFVTFEDAAAAPAAHLQPALSRA